MEGVDTCLSTNFAQQKYSVTQQGTELAISFTTCATIDYQLSYTYFQPSVELDSPIADLSNVITGKISSTKDDTFPADF